ncbi:organic cation transporter protein-like [Battus philenor]|uniref:organic cation transporter protein-like n=1 Tax=Battus philenor TaxID=42288 RepID=UPI0035D0AB5E
MESQKRDDNGEERTPVPQDAFEKIMGSFGRYQLWLCFVIFLSKFFVSFNQMAIIFLAPKTTYICEDTKAETCPCNKPIYDTSIFPNTIVTEWDLICERKWLISLTQTFFQVGTLIGSIVFGMASDKYGRKIPTIFAMVLQMVTSISAAYAPNYWIFTIIRILIGIAVGGSMVTTFVLLMEFIGNKYRETVSALYHTPYNIGHMILPLNAYFFRNFRQFQLSISIPSAILMSYFCLLPESPRWLVAVERTDKAIGILERAAKINKQQVSNIRSEIEAYHAQLLKNKSGKGTIKDLFRTPNLRKNIMCMGFIWMTCSYCFYGVSQYVGQLYGNVFINVVSSASVCLLGTLSSIPLMKIAGRKKVVITFNSICAICLLSLMFIEGSVFSVVLACIGVVSSFIVFVVVYLYCSELFPTVVRNAAIGYSSMMARVGSMIAPFVVEAKDTAPWLPPLAFAILPIIACIVTLFLPETKDCDLMSSLEEGENFGKKSSKK